jgi:hypothetical protein
MDLREVCCGSMAGRSCMILVRCLGVKLVICECSWFWLLFSWTLSGMMGTKAVTFSCYSSPHCSSQVTHISLNSPVYHIHWNTDQHFHTWYRCSPYPLQSKNLTNSSSAYRNRTDCSTQLNLQETIRFVYDCDIEVYARYYCSWIVGDVVMVLTLESWMRWMNSFLRWEKVASVLSLEICFPHSSYCFKHAWLNCTRLSSWSLTPYCLLVGYACFYWFTRWIDW